MRRWWVGTPRQDNNNNNNNCGRETSDHHETTTDHEMIPRPRCLPKNLGLFVGKARGRLGVL